MQHNDERPKTVSRAVVPAKSGSRLLTLVHATARNIFQSVKDRPISALELHLLSIKKNEAS